MAGHRPNYGKPVCQLWPIAPMQKCHFSVAKSFFSFFFPQKNPFPQGNMNVLVKFLNFYKHYKGNKPQRAVFQNQLLGYQLVTPALIYAFIPLFCINILKLFNRCKTPNLQLKLSLYFFMQMMMNLPNMLSLLPVDFCPLKFLLVMSLPNFVFIHQS